MTCCFLKPDRLRLEQWYPPIALNSYPKDLFMLLVFSDLYFNNITSYSSESRVPDDFIHTHRLPAFFPRKLQGLYLLYYLQRASRTSIELNRTSWYPAIVQPRYCFSLSYLSSSFLLRQHCDVLF